MPVKNYRQITVDLDEPAEVALAAICERFKSFHLPYNRSLCVRWALIQMESRMKRVERESEAADGTERFGQTPAPLRID